MNGSLIPSKRYDDLILWVVHFYHYLAHFRLEGLLLSSSFSDIVALLKSTFWNLTYDVVYKDENITTWFFSLQSFSYYSEHPD